MLRVESDYSELNRSGLYQRRWRPVRVSFEELVATIYEAALDTSRWPDALRQIEQLSCAFTGHLFVGRGEHSQVFAKQVGFPNSAFAMSYRQRYAQLDPMPRFALSQPPGQLVTDEDVLPKRTFLNSEFYYDWIRPQGVYSCLYTNVFRNGGHIANLCLARNRGARQFGSKDAVLISQIVPHIRRAVEIHFRLSDTVAQRDALGQALDHGGQEAILADKAGKVVFASPGAEARLSMRDGLADGPHGLCAGSATETGALRRLIANGFETVPDGRNPTTLKLHRPDERQPLSVTVVPAAALGPVSGAGGRHVMLLVSDPEHRSLSLSETLRDLYGLTKSEVRLAEMIAAGHTLAAAAEQLGVAIGTVRNQIKQVFQKTDTHRQSQLLSLLLRLPGGSAA